MVSLILSLISSFISLFRHLSCRLFRQVWRVEGQGGVVIRPVFGSGVAGTRDVEVIHYVV